ncbi:MAG: glycosyltransferase [Oscillospiraceae bacterium]|nr:glycosyltransferase [Oscillospiraceae bacterium]
MGKATSISLCMIVKNEERFLARALEGAKAVLGFEDMVVIDTGSTDKTRDIALAAGASVFDFTWVDDFSAARNFAADMAKNDWIFVLDADEEVVEAELSELGAFIEDAYAIGAVTALELSNQECHPATKLYNRRHFRFEGRIHEQLASSSEAVRRPPIGAVPVVVHHYGYLPEVVESKGKNERNESMLKKQLENAPDDAYVLYQLGKCYYANADLQQACFYFDKALAAFSKDAGADFRYGYIYSAVECYGYALINTDQFEKAMELVEVFAPHYQESPSFRFLCAHVLQNNGLFVEAVECYESCIGANIADPRGITSFLSYYNIGVILECIDMVEDAVQMYKNCGNYEPAKLRLAELGAQ